MDAKYKILWLDDDFAELDPFIGKDENESRRIFQDDVNLSSEWGFEIVGVKNLEEFKSELSRIGSYQAVIVDLRGMTAKGKVDEYVAHDALELLEQTKKLPVYVYSGNTNMPNHEGMLRKIKKDGRAFKKSDGVDLLYERILSDLDSSYHYYSVHPECLKLFTEGFLSPDRKSSMDEIMSNFADIRQEYDPYNKMRKILENMFQNLSSMGVIKVIDTDKNDRFNSRIDYLCNKYHQKKDKEGRLMKTNKGTPLWDYDNPYVPFTICNLEIRYLIKFLGDMTNFYSHHLEKYPEHIKPSGAGYQYNVLVQEATYAAFFAVMKWYYSFMSSKLNK